MDVDILHVGQVKDSDQIARIAREGILARIEPPVLDEEMVARGTSFQEPGHQA